jgi:dyslexia susceptibility 1 candidate gene 1 protein
VSDCSKALSFLPDTREGSEVRDLRAFRLKLKLYVRRGTAYCRLEQFTSAKADYGVTLTMDTQNEQLKDDFVQLVALEKAHELKLAADEAVRAKQPDLVQSIKLYSESLRLHPLSVACLSNRAACYLMLKEGNRSIDDCSSALELLQREGGGQIGAGGLAFFSVGPPPGSSKRREWVVRTLVRRGTAFRSIGQLSKGKT